MKKSKHIVFIILCFVFFFTTKAQNLVPNPSFEDTTDCTYNSLILKNIPPWFQPTQGTPDYFNNCLNQTQFTVPNNYYGYQNPRTGNAYIGLINTGISFYPNYREYIEVPLLDSLKANKKYFIQLYVSLANKSKYSIDRLGAYVSTDTIKSNNTSWLNYIPQVQNLIGNFINDTLNWVLISDTITATGGEKFLTIGNFYNDTLTNRDTLSGSIQYSYYYIDDISVVLDTTSVGIMDLTGSGSKFKLFPNPNNGKMILDYSLNSNDKSEIVIYDVTGKLITSYLLDNKNTQLSINNEQLNNGIYFYHIIVNDKVVKSDKLVIIK